LSENISKYSSSTKFQIGERSKNMKNVKGFLGLSVVLIFAILLMGVGAFSSPAMAAGEPAAQLETYPLEAEVVPVCTPDADGMVAYWPLDDAPATTTFVDVIENTAFNDGACVGDTCPTQNPTGKVSSAFDFEIVPVPTPPPTHQGDEIRVTNTVGLDFTVAGDMTVEAWVKTTQDCTDRAVFAGRYEGSSSAAWWLGCIENDVARFHMRDSNNQAYTVKGTKVINDGQWHHIVGTRDGTANVNKIYVDGVLENSLTPAFTGELTFAAKNVTIGFFAPSPYYWFSGTLDETALYSQALSAEDVSRHYLGGQGQSYCSGDPPIANGTTLQTQKNTALPFTGSKLLENDVAPDGGLQLKSISPTSTNGGTITGTGPYTYTPPTNFTGADTFNYVIMDQFNQETTGQATVQVTEPGEKKIYLPLLLNNYSQ
jgi:hypothetical protein